MGGHNEKDELKAAFTDRELAVAKANLRASNSWGLTWQSERKNWPPDPRVARLLRTRAIIYRKVYLKMFSSLQGLKAKRILDIGCGTSDYLGWLANDCKQLVGVDISVEMLKLCRLDWGNSLELVAADALHLPFKDEAFDISTTFQALHHFPDWKKALGEMVRTSRQVNIYEPNGDSFLHILMHLIRKYFRVERRFKQTDEDYSLVEFQASGFHQRRMIKLLKSKNFQTKVTTSGVTPISVLERIANISLNLFRLFLLLEEFFPKIPILRNQLGNLLLIGWKQNKLNDGVYLSRGLSYYSLKS